MHLHSHNVQLKFHALTGSLTGIMKSTKVRNTRCFFASLYIHVGHMREYHTHVRVRKYNVCIAHAPIIINRRML